MKFSIVFHPHELKGKDAFLDTIKTYPSVSTAKPFLSGLFENDANFEAYKLLAQRTFLNYVEFKQIRVQYDNRAIEKSSFGQRCTVVLVILLLLGNNPIIIDEPEAHLDSHLIANYLVGVIKKSKQNRQIIFATHNANFVVNGDAELIHILTVNEETGVTSISSTTIENEATRDILIGLEGGKETFLKHESKYQF